jgi:hypothetical protein
MSDERGVETPAEMAAVLGGATGGAGSGQPNAAAAEEFDRVKPVDATGDDDDKEEEA